mgnify:CR=1 FL=1
MEKKYINEARYKKGTTRKRRDSRTVKSNLNTKSNLKVVIKEKPIPKKKIRKRKVENKAKNIVICIILLIVIAIVSRAILKDENEPFIPLPFITNSNDEIIKIGIITTESLLDNNTNNIVLMELNKYSKDMLLEINEDYSITYRVLSEVVKVSNKEYLLIKNKECDVTVQDIKKVIEDNKLDKESPYYTKLTNIESVTIVNENELNIKLKQEDAYFIYNLDIPLNSYNSLTNYLIDSSSTDNMLVFNRHKKADKQLPLKIIVTKYKDVYAAVEAYKEKDINVFVTNAENVQNLLGKYEYNITTYKNGQNIFLFGNPKSKAYSKQEVRQALAYSIDRDGIIQDALKSKGTKIDLPYIYDNVKYRYDIYAAENLLLTNGYKKINNVYSKTENGEKIILELDLLVNKNDEIKVKIANKIKNNLGSMGIKVNVKKLTEAKLKTSINKGDYDLILANVNLNNNPDISFVKNSIYVSEILNELMESIEKSAICDLSKNITALKNTLSEQVSTIGVYSDISYLVYSKDVIGIDNVSYMNLFKNLLD